MSRQSEPKNLEELIDRLEHAATKSDQVTLDQMLDEIGRRSFGPLLLLGGTFMMAPVIGDIPGVPVMIGLYIVLVAGQVVFGRDHFWLPQWLLRRSVSSAKIKKTTGKWLRKPSRFIDRFLRHRMHPLVGSTAVRLIAIACAALSLCTPIAEFIPFSANGIGVSIVLFGLALIANDGLMALLGWVAVAITVCLAAYAAG